MPHPCVVCGRSRMNPNNREEEYMFFGFPVNDEERCRKWLEFCCREDLYKLTKKQLLQRMVCSKHFEQKDFLNDYFDRLNCTAVPSIYDPKQSLYNITCVLCGRFRKDPPDLDYDGATFHHFPGEEFRCLKWLDFVGVDSYYRLTRKEILFCYICSKHFDDSQFMYGYKNRLIDQAVPNIKYTDQNSQEEMTEPFAMEAVPELKMGIVEKKKLDPLPQAVLESQACAACGRLRSDPKNKAERYKFHPFPAYEIGRCLRWCQFLGREDLLKMSPNQIRKLVLCSKHFQTGQSFHKVGPCDAVPTIKDVSQVLDTSPDKDEPEAEFLESPEKKRSVSRPMVSSKKPKVDNKPMPLAKKRGKSKRPTSINIPRPDPDNIENRVIRKLPLPPATNFKLVSANQFQPIALSQPTDIKKVIFTGDISNLGAPIPVHSLSSIPPGLLIKINLPETQMKPLTKAQAKKRGRKTPRKSTRKNSKRGKNSAQMELSAKMEETRVILEEEQEEDGYEEILPFSPEPQPETLNSDELEVQEEVVLPHHAESETHIMENFEALDIKEELSYDESLIEEKPVVEQQRVKRKISARTRKTILPIRSQVNYFLSKIKPHMHRLPRKSRAQLKLAIVNLVIDHL